MSVRRSDSLRRKQQQCHRPIVMNDIGFNNPFMSILPIIRSTTSTKHSFLSTIFIIVVTSSLIVKNNVRDVQALQISTSLPPPAILQQLLQSQMDGTLNSDSDYDGPILLPCCYDGLTARLIARHEMKSSNAKQQQQRFQATFMTGFGVSAIHGIPDTQLISYHEMIQSCTIITEALQSVAIEQDLPYPIPCIAVRLLENT
jgi:hypothetical protein